MKHIARIMTAGLMLMAGSAVAQSTMQSIPAVVTEVYVEGNTRLKVVSSTAPSYLEAACNQPNLATISGRKLYIKSGVADEVVLGLEADRSIKLSAEESGSIVIAGALPMRQSLELCAEDDATILFRGHEDDTMFCRNLTIHTEDNAELTSEVFFAVNNYTITAEDRSNINLFGLATGRESRSRLDIQDHAHFNCRNHSVDGTNSGMLSRSGSDGDYVDHDMSFKGSETKRATNPWRYSRDAALQFSWGLHNWSHSRNPIHGFEGVNDDWAIRTTANHLHLAYVVPICGTRHFGLYAGLGLDWDKYKFTDSRIISVVDGISSNSPTASSTFYTRYIVVPLTMRFDFGRGNDWALELTALPGLHWSGKRTGERVKYTYKYGTTEQRLLSSNQLVNPYKLDLRVALRYSGVGLYVQVPTMSTFNDKVEGKYYPVSVGMMINL